MGKDKERDREVQRAWVNRHRTLVNERARIRWQSNQRQREQRLESHRAWTKKNREHCSEYRARWNENNRERARQTARVYRENNRDKICEKKRRSYIKNIEKRREYERRRRKQRKKYNLEYIRKNSRRINEARRLKYSENPKLHTERAKQYQVKNREKVCKRMREYRRNGPQNPIGKLQWLRKAQAQSRRLNRILIALSRGASPSSDDLAAFGISTM